MSRKASGAARSESARAAAVALAIACAVGALYVPVLRYPFVSFDDPHYVVENRHVTAGLTTAGVGWAFTTGHAANWHPATWLSHMVDWQLFGPWAGGHHLTSVVLHALAAALLSWVLYRMTGALGASAVTAALFGLHPLRVESVAWIAERKDVLCTLGWVATMWAYLRWVERPSPGRYALVTAGVVLALLAKPMAVTLPFALLVLDVWPLGRAGAPPSLRALLRLVPEKIPFLAASAGMSVVTFVVQSRGRAVASLADLPLVVRLLNAPLAYAAYLRKTIWPVDLAVFYPTPRDFSLASVAAASALLLAITAVAVRARRAQPYLLVGWLWYLGTLVPVIGLVRAGDQGMADRFTYVPSIGLLAALVWGCAHVLGRRPPLLAAVAAVAIGLSAWASARQIPTWRDNHALYEQALRVTRDNGLAHMNLGLQLLDERATAAAMDHLRRAAELNPTSAKAHLNLGLGLTKLGRLPEAYAEYDRAIRLDPESATTHFDIAVTLVDQGLPAEAVPHYQEAIRLDPEYAKSYAGLGLALARQGRTAEAVEQYRAALRLAPDLSEAHANLAVALEKLGAMEEAAMHYETAVRLAPDDARARFNLAAMLSERGRPDEAIEHLRAAARLAPELPEAWAGLGDVLRAKGDGAGALAAYREALRRRPDWPEVAAAAAELEAAGRNRGP